MLREKLNADLKEAMKNKNVVLRDVIRLIIAALKTAEMEKTAVALKKADSENTTLTNADIQQKSPLSEQEEMAVLQKMTKQRRDSIGAYEQGGRDDLAQAEREELKVIEGYLPQQMGDDEIRTVVREAITKAGITDIKDIGKIMGPLMGQLRGKADGTAVQRITREELS
jgi:uncharacterized protein YqeY